MEHKDIIHTHEVWLIFTIKGSFKVPKFNNPRVKSKFLIVVKKYYNIILLLAKFRTFIRLAQNKQLLSVAYFPGFPLFYYSFNKH